MHPIFTVEYPLTIFTDCMHVFLSLNSPLNLIAIFTIEIVRTWLGQVFPSIVAPI